MTGKELLRADDLILEGLMLFVQRKVAEAVIAYHKDAEAAVADAKRELVEMEHRFDNLEELEKRLVEHEREHSA